MPELLNPLRPENLAKLAKNGHFRTLSTATGWTETNIGTGDTTFYHQYLIQTVAANTDSTLASSVMAGLQAGNDSLLNPSRINWGKKLYLGGALWRESSTANLIARIQLKDAGTIGALGEKGIGLQITNYAMIGESYGAALGNTGALLTTISRRTYDWCMILNPGVSVQYLIDNVVVGTYSTVANLPSGEGAASGQLVISFLNSSGGAAAGREFGVGGLWIWQEK